MPEEEHLSGGNTTIVVRVGDTVRRPVGPWTLAVHDLLDHLTAAGFSGSPRVRRRYQISDDEAEALCAQADAEGRSMQEIARAAVREYVDRRTLRGKVEQAMDDLTPRYADLLDRLGR